MSNVKKTDKFKIFSIIAAVVFALVGIFFVGEFLLDNTILVLLGVNLDLLSYLKYIVFLALVPVCCLAAVLLLIIKKNSVLAYIPIGLLSYYLFVASLGKLFNAVFSFAGPWVAAQPLDEIFSLACAVVLTAVVFALAMLLRKKLPFLPMAILALVMLVLLLLQTVIIGILFYDMVTYYIPQYLSNGFEGLKTYLIFRKLIILPLFEFGLSIFIFIGTVLAAIGLISRPKV